MMSATPASNWFEDLFGFKEHPDDIRKNIEFGDFYIKRYAKNYERLRMGKLDIVNLTDLQGMMYRNRSGIPNRVSEIVADVGVLHTCNPDALFQVASQFNLLEMVNPSVKREDGITNYVYDKTQGPACAMACPAALLYRNYCHKEVNCLHDFERLFGFNDCPWTMHNGYTIFHKDQLVKLNVGIREGIKLGINFQNLIKYGVTWDAQVVHNGEEYEHNVSQIYCSAVPISYNSHVITYPTELEAFSRLVLDSAYMATMYAAIHNVGRGVSNKLFLTMLGGGAFGNPVSWIQDAMLKALKLFDGWNLEICIVSYGQSNPDVLEIIRRYNDGRN